ncbi:MAG TPA: hypothetical protein VLA34_12200 [Candidatus Krumholzibacterium sp.]|nr:hypothetical protein [Candidatus Krumholzibacterium sp.]
MNNSTTLRHETRTYRGRPACAGSCEPGTDYTTPWKDWEGNDIIVTRQQCSVCGRQGISPVYKGENKGNIGTHIHQNDLR